MPVLCMQKKDSNLPLCTLHNVLLKQQEFRLTRMHPHSGALPAMFVRSAARWFGATGILCTQVLLSRCTKHRAV